MRELNNETITKEIIEEVNNNCRFVDKPNLKNYDYITIEDDFIEITKEEEYKRNENLEYVKVTNREVRQFKKNNLSGVFVEC